jgi:hypothetical protein
MPQHKGLARIHQPPKSAMQSGRGRTHGWVLEYEPSEAKALDPLTGWVGSGDMRGQVRLHFATREQAVAYAVGEGIAFEVEAPPTAAGPMKPKVYADNFRFGRSENWSH